MQYIFCFLFSLSFANAATSEDCLSAEFWHFTLDTSADAGSSRPDSVFGELSSTPGLYVSEVSSSTPSVSTTQRVVSPDDMSAHDTFLKKLKRKYFKAQEEKWDSIKNVVETLLYSKSSVFESLITFSIDRAWALESVIAQFPRSPMNGAEFSELLQGLSLKGESFSENVIRTFNDENDVLSKILHKRVEFRLTPKAVANLVIAFSTVPKTTSKYLLFVNCFLIADHFELDIESNIDTIDVYKTSTNKLLIDQIMDMKNYAKFSHLFEGLGSVV
jgi:hypothetical protein